MTETYPYLAIEGNIGSGKTSLSKLLSERFGRELVLEEFEENPYLQKFYDDPERFAFQLELNFLADRYRQFKDRVPQPSLFENHFISDYTIDKCLIFAQSNLVEEEYMMYRKIHGILTKDLPRPDLTLYLYMPLERLKRNIAKRGRPYEEDITEEYLRSIDLSYNRFFMEHPNQKVVVLELQEADFVNEPKTLDQIHEICLEKHPIGIRRIAL
jgi:deoxyguanosine kinase